MQRHLLRLQIRDQFLDPVNCELIPDSQKQFPVMLDLLVEWGALVAHRGTRERWGIVPSLMSKSYLGGTFTQRVFHQMNTRASLFALCSRGPTSLTWIKGRTGQIRTARFKLGYLGISTQNIDEWSEFATRQVGLQLVDRTASSRAFRMDDR